jgi:hypothetical protein
MITGPSELRRVSANLPRFSTYRGTADGSPRANPAISSGVGPGYGTRG